MFQENQSHSKVLRGQEPGFHSSQVLIRLGCTEIQVALMPVTQSGNMESQV